MSSPWGADHGITWENADTDTKKDFALQRLFWFYRFVTTSLVNHSGNVVIEDGLDQEVWDQAHDAADWIGPLLKERAGL